MGDLSKKLSYPLKKRIYSTDASILEGLRNNDNMAWKLLYKEHTNSLRQMVLNKGGSELDADEIEQEALIVLWEKIQNPDFKLTSKISTYLYGVARIKLLERFRKEGKTFSSNQDDISDEEDFSEFDTEPQTDLQRVLVLSLSEITEKCRQILTLFYLKKEKMEKVAEFMGLAHADAAKKRKYKCFKRLQEIAIAKLNKM